MGGANNMLALSRGCIVLLILTQQPGNARMVYLNRLAMILLLGVVAVGAAGCKPQAGVEPGAVSPEVEPVTHALSGSEAQPDLSGRTRFGNGSFYAKKGEGREMADGNKMNPRGDNAASKTLPLGTTAKVTNTETGHSAVVTIQDRGPYVEGRIVDLSPSTAQKIGITHDSGIAKVKVAPILVPLPDGSTRPGAATPNAAP
jgi:rare lipoprotein A